MQTNEVNGKDASLSWDVYITPGIPVVTSTPAPNTKETFWNPISSTLIYGNRDAVLVDTFIRIKHLGDLVKWVAASGKNLTTIYITHGHGDHWFGIGALLDRFANVKAVATADVLKVMRRQMSPEFVASFWEARYPGQIPEHLVLPEQLRGNVIDLEGRELVAVEVGHTDTDNTTCLHVPSVGLVVAGDAAYNDVHL